MQEGTFHSICYSIKSQNKKFDELIKRKFIYTNSYEIYNGVAGLFDLGPIGTALQNNIIRQWRRYFIQHDDMLELSTSALAPERVFEASGHLDKFADFMVKDLKNGQCFRADELLGAVMKKKLKKDSLNIQKRKRYEEIISNADNYTQNELSDLFVEYNIKSPETGNDLSSPLPMNLMFPTQLGPTGKTLGYLRPETAQGIFVNYKRCLDYNNGRLPMAVAQIGPAYRNEISPRSGLLR